MLIFLKFYLIFNLSFLNALPIKTKQPDNKNQALSKTALTESQTLSHQCGNIRNDRQALKQTED